MKSAHVFLVSLLIAGCATVPYSPAIDPRDFAATIDNPFLPLPPGARFIYEGATDAGLERIEVVVTREVRIVMGVRCVVVRDTVWLNGQLTEDTYDWFAQDRAGNVWYFGEETKDYKAGTVVSTKGSWEAGIDGALPGIIMKAHPAVGDSYRQEYYRGEAEDMAEVVAVDERASVAAGSFSGCLKILEWTPLDPGKAEYKFYAPSVGPVLETVRGTRERVELKQVIKE